MTDADDASEAEAGIDGQGNGAGGSRGEQRFQVLEAEAEAEEAHAQEELLVLGTDRGRVELAPPGRDDRDSMLMGFELLLASFGDGGPAKGTAFPKRGGGGLPERNAEQHRSRRWEEGLVGRGGMTLESSDEDSDGEEDENRHRR